MDDEWTAKSETEVVQLFKKLKREHQSGSEDQIDNDLAFAADHIPTKPLVKRYDNTRGFEPT